MIFESVLFLKIGLLLSSIFLSSKVRGLEVSKSCDLSSGNKLSFSFLLPGLRTNNAKTAQTTIPKTTMRFIGLDVFLISFLPLYASCRDRLGFLFGCIILLCGLILELIFDVGLF